MSTQPQWSEPRPCMTCKHFGWWNAGKGGTVWCLDGQYVNSTPAVGCAFWRKWVIYPANGQEPEAENPPDPKAWG